MSEFGFLCIKVGATLARCLLMLRRTAQRHELSNPVLYC